MSDLEHSTVIYTSISRNYEKPSVHPPSPIYVPNVLKLVYPKFIPPENDVLLNEEQPLPVAILPTVDSLGYITESNPEEDLEEEDEEDPMDDPTDYPTNRDDEEEESSRDNVDDEEEDKGEDEEEEHVPPPAYHTTARMSIRA
nr:hypothetical protein [Tanacetum cinerariifolium]